MGEEIALVVGIGGCFKEEVSLEIFRAEFGEFFQVLEDFQSFKEIVYSIFSLFLFFQAGSEETLNLLS
jgi:hypothetical protein